MAGRRLIGGRVGWIIEHPHVRQFVKFCIVGASSTAVTFLVYYLLIYQLHIDERLYRALSGSPQWQKWLVDFNLHVQVAALGGWIFGVTNGFLWNSRWTFRVNDPLLRRVQYMKFLAVNVVGLILNQTILFVVLWMLTNGESVAKNSLQPLIAFAVATVIVVFWNFTANKLWTFKG